MPECAVVRIKSTHPESQGPFVEINAGDFDAEKHERYDAPPPPPPSLPPPPPPPPGPLDSLPKDWKSKSPQELRDLAQRITGRMPENKLQATQVIEAELAKAGK